MSNEYGTKYYQDPITKLWGYDAYSWVNNILVMSENTVIESMSREEFFLRYPNMVAVPNDPRPVNK